MPELPEVETMVRGLTPLAGRTVTRVATCRCRLKPISIRPGVAAIRRHVAGSRVDSIERFGKRVVLGFGSGYRLVFEPRMTGLVLLAEPPDTGHLRFSLDFHGDPPTRFLFWDRRGLGTIRGYTAAQWSSFLEEKRVGPDALAVNQHGFRARLEASRSALKVALMDQRRLAGIGNLYASEILYRAGLDPTRPCLSLNDHEWQTLWRAARSILQQAIRYEGSTLADGTYRNALNRSGQYQDRHRVYGKSGESCRRCRQGKITRIVQNQRATFYCPRCQK